MRPDGVRSAACRSVLAARRGVEHEILRTHQTGDKPVPKPPFVALAIAAALALAGCGGSSSKSSTAASTPAASTPGSTTARTTPSSSAAATPFLSQLTKVSTLASTVPANGDVNPYGLAMVPSSVGKLQAGALLVSNFNGKSNNQGTGTTIVQVTTGGKLSLFSHITAHGLPGSCPGGVGLTTALSVVPGGYVVVGSLPTTNGKSATARYGCLIVLDPNGHPVSTIAGPNIQGPWDMTAATQGADTSLFVSMVLNGGAKKGLHTVKNSTVVRIQLSSGAGQPPKVLSQTVIANKIPWRDDPTALAIGPTGVALGANGTLYLADTLDNRVSAIPQAMTRTTPAPDGGTTISVGKHLKQPLGLALAPNGDILTTNAGDGNIVETSPAGQQLLTRTADKKTGAGTLFGLVVAPGGSGIYYVDDGDNTLKTLTAGSAAGAPSSTTAAAPAAAASALSLAADPGGALKFTSTSLTAKAGKVTITFTNMSPVMHNLTIEQGTSGSVVGATPTFQGGTKTLTVKLKPGTYTFFCSVPGHRDAGMKGTLTVS
jgi:plastocyanin